jgi:hypothetical protein
MNVYSGSTLPAFRRHVIEFWFMLLLDRIGLLGGYWESREINNIKEGYPVKMSDG